MELKKRIFSHLHWTGVLLLWQHGYNLILSSKLYVKGTASDFLNIIETLERVQPVDRSFYGDLHEISDILIMCIESDKIPLRHK